MTTKVPEFISDIVARLKSMDRRYLYLILAIIFLIVSVIIFLSVRNHNAQKPTFVPTGNQTPQPTPMLSPISQTQAPVRSEVWTVELREEKDVKDGRFFYAVAVFKNVGDGSLQRAQCQVPKWTFPPIGKEYKLVNTQGNIWFFIPVEQREQNGKDMPFQYFAPIP